MFGSFCNSLPWCTSSRLVKANKQQTCWESRAVRITLCCLYCKHWMYSYYNPKQRAAEYLLSYTVEQIWGSFRPFNKLHTQHIMHLPRNLFSFPNIYLWSLCIYCMKRFTKNSFAVWLEKQSLIDNFAFIFCFNRCCGHKTCSSHEEKVIIQSSYPQNQNWVPSRARIFAQYPEGAEIWTCIHFLLPQL